ncbi:unnamed protein product [Echinostoma caproni]|uniref:Proteasome assembly chaperone 1 n=1 Tax=Echinostoma caproni TaxID=27848 RepID=A0A183BH14_9TREM|nr:unnamed protein product [Echinostoma caproni]
MDFFLKRIPAFSRALGEWESDEDSETEKCLNEELACVGSEDKPVVLSHVFHNLTVKNVLIGIGPLQTAFVTCAYQLSNENMIAVISYRVPGFGSTQKTIPTQVRLHYHPTASGGTVCVLIPASKQIPHANQKKLVQLIMDSILNSSSGSRGDILATILCTEPICQFQSRTPPDSPSFVRILTTQNLEKPKDDLQCAHLEQPNIISGLAAEFLTWNKLHSVPASLYVLFYTTLDNPNYAWHSAKEIFRIVSKIKALSTVLASPCSNWDNLNDTALKDSCIMYICGDKPSKMDQMYT